MAPGKFDSALRRWGFSPVGIVAVLLVFAGFFLAVTVHIVFFAVLAVGAFGPGLLRQLGFIRDLDECQKRASVEAAHRAFIAAGLFLTAVIVARNWGKLSLGDDLVPASLVLALVLVVYAVSYCLSFWDPRQAAFLVLLSFGVFWLVFVVLSHGNEPGPLFAEAGLVAVPFILAAFLAKRWPRVIGLLLLAAGIAAIFFFHLIPPAGATPERMFGKIGVIILLPLPLALMGLALLGRRARTEEQ